MKVSNSRVLIAALLACGTTLATSGCRSSPGKPGGEGEVVRPEQVVDFARLYGQNCAACHGAGGKNGAAISIANPVYLAIAGGATIQRVTANGVSSTAMPPFSKGAGGMLTDQQIAILAAGMESAWGNPAVLAGQTLPTYASSESGDPAQGKQEFGHYCARCHGAEGMGTSANGVVTGSLIDPAYLALISDQGLRSIILAGQTEQGSHDWRSYGNGPTPHPIGDQEIADIVAWLAPHRIATPGQPYRQHP